MTRRKQPQQTLWEGIVAEDVKSLWEPWMVEADKLLDEEELIDRVYDAQGERHENRRTRGRSQTPAEMAHPVHAPGTHSPFRHRSEAFPSATSARGAV